MTSPITYTEFCGFGPRTQARISWKIQRRLGLDPQPDRKITNAMLRSLTDEEAADFRAIGDRQLVPRDHGRRMRLTAQLKAMLA